MPSEISSSGLLNAANINSIVIIEDVVVSENANFHQDFLAFPSVKFPKIWRRGMKLFALIRARFSQKFISSGKNRKFVKRLWVSNIPVPQVSPGDQLLSIEPQDSGHEIAPGFHQL